MPLRATSGGALIYRDGTVEFGMGGEAVLLPDGQTISCMLSYQGFPSVAASGLALKHGSWYYEVSLLTAGLMQIGWATPKFTGSCNDGEGVGDDEHSFAYDGFRQLKWSNGEPQRWGRKWKQGDVVCCAVDMDSGVIQYTLNGEWNTGVTTVAFADLNLTERGLMPALSFRKGEKCCINFGQPNLLMHHRLNTFGELTLRTILNGIVRQISQRLPVQEKPRRNQMQLSSSLRYC